MNSLLNPTQCWGHTGSRAWPCLAFPSAQTPVAAALPELFHLISVHWQGRAEKEQTGCVEKGSGDVGSALVLLLPLSQPQLCYSALPTQAGNPPSRMEQSTWWDTSDSCDPEPTQELSLRVIFQRSAKPWWGSMGCRQFCHLHSRHGYWGYFLPNLTAACWKTGVQPGSLSFWVNKQACILLKKPDWQLKKTSCVVQTGRAVKHTLQGVGANAFSLVYNHSTMKYPEHK